MRAVLKCILFNEYFSFLIFKKKKIFFFPAAIIHCICFCLYALYAFKKTNASKIKSPGRI